MCGAFTETSEDSILWMNPTLDVYRGSWLTVLVLETESGSEALRVALEEIVVGVCDMGRGPRLEVILGIFEGVDSLLKAEPFAGVEYLGVLATVETLVTGL